MSSAGKTLIVHARLGGVEYELEESDTHVRFAGPEFEVTFDPRAPSDTLDVEQAGSDDIIDLAPRALMLVLGRAALDTARVNYVNMVIGQP